MKAVGVGVLVVLVLVAVVVTGSVLGWFGRAVQVAQEEFSPEELLRKYEWFKDVAAQLDKKRADAGVFETRLKAMEDAYEGAPRSKWAREDREQYNVWLSEIAGVKASYNQLAAEYNAQMAKFNWRFANVGTLPKGADEPLPREFKSYVTK